MAEPLLTHPALWSQARVLCGRGDPWPQRWPASPHQSVGLGQVCAQAWSAGLILSDSDSPYFWLHHRRSGYVYSTVTEGLVSSDH